MAKNLYTGFHAVEEKLRRYAVSKDSSVKLHVFYSKAGPRIKKILAEAQEAGVAVEQVAPAVLDEMVKRLPPLAQDHRGIVLEADGEAEKEQNLVQLDQWLEVCPENATVVVLDSVTDPHNVGAIIRSCDQFGVSLVVLPERNSPDAVHENEVIARSSAGSSAWVPISVVSNLTRAAQMLKDAGFWVYGADAGGSALQSTDFPAKTCIVMGSEGSGISRLLREQCDVMVSIPTCGKIDSLNVSVAAGILLYDRYRKTL